MLAIVDAREFVMNDKPTIEGLFSATVYDESGSKVGSVSQVYTDDMTQQPSWVSVNTGFFGTKETLVPMAKARISGDEIHVPYSKSFIKDAPNMDADQHLDADAEKRLYDYYGEDYSADPRAAAGRDVGDRADVGPGLGDRKD